MATFFKRLSLFAVPALLLLAWVTWMDFFRLFGFQDYYRDQMVGLNRGMITTKTYNHFRESEGFNAFIFGSSRSQAFKCRTWQHYLPDDAVPFHFDGSGEGIWNISKKIEYIDALGDTLAHALVVLDRSVLRLTYPQTGHLFIPMPCISKGSPLQYYFTFYQAALNPRFLTAYLDYRFFGTHRPYMGFLFRSNVYDHTIDPVHCDMWYGWDKEIAADSLAYYRKRIEAGAFYSRPGPAGPECRVSDQEVSQLRSMKRIFDQHQTDYRIIIAPTYDQVPLEAEQLELLQQLFGDERVFDFTGQNPLTEPLGNYYESSHFRPHVADAILDTLYRKGP